MQDETDGPGYLVSICGATLEVFQVIEDPCQYESCLQFIRVSLSP